MRTLYLCGAGNSEGVRLALTVQKAQGRWDRLVLLDDDSGRHGGSLLGVPIVGGLALLSRVDPEDAAVVNLVARTTRRRAAVHQRLLDYGVPFATLISPDVDTFGVELGAGVIAYQNVTLGPESSIGAGTVVFMGAVVGHESHVGACCVLAANSVLNARVHLEDGVYVGTNATVLPETAVGGGTTVGAGSVVIGDLPAGATAMGVPAQVVHVEPDAARTARPGGHQNRFRAETMMPGLTGAEATPLRPEPGDHAALQEAIASIWCELLLVEAVGLDQNFFDLGGSSLLAMRLCQRLKDGFVDHLSIVDVFRCPTVRSLADRCAQAAPALRRGEGDARAPRNAASRRAEFRRQRRGAAFGGDGEG